MYSVTASQLKVYLSAIIAVLDEFHKQNILPTQPEILEAIKTITKISEDELALRLLAACLDDVPRGDVAIEAARAAAAAAASAAAAAAAVAAAERLNKNETPK